MTNGVNYAVSVPSTFNEDQYVDAIDFQVSQANHLSFKSVLAQQPQFNAFPSATLPGFGTYQQFTARLYSLTDTHIFTSNLVNEARFGVNRALGSTGFQNLIPLSSIGMNRFNSAQFPDIPSIVLSGGFTIGYSVNADQADADTTYQYFDTLSWIHGKHQIQAGAEARRYQDNYFSNNRTRGTMTIHSFPDFLLGLSGSSVATAAMAAATPTSTAAPLPAASPPATTVSATTPSSPRIPGTLSTTSPSTTASAGSTSGFPSIRAAATATSTSATTSPRPLAPPHPPASSSLQTRTTSSPACPSFPTPSPTPSAS